MVRTLKVIFCEEQHGTGDITFPDMSTLNEQQFVDNDVPMTVPQLRKKAKAAGWGRVNGGDYCPSCMESM